MHTSIIKWLVPVAIATGTAIACNGLEQPRPTDAFVLEASLPDGAATRTSLSPKDGDIYHILWQAGDKVSVNGTISDGLPTGDYSESSAVFSFSSAPAGTPYRVLYPASSSTNVVSVPVVQNYVAGSFDPAAFIGFGTAVPAGDKYRVSLDNFCGVLRFAFTGSATLDKIVFKALGGEKLSGSFTLATDSEGFSGAFSGGDSDTMTYSFGTSGLALNGSGQYAFVALPAQSYSAGIEALVYQKDGAYMRLKFWGSGLTLAGTDFIEFESKAFAAGRSENLFSIGELTAEAGGEPTAEAPGITVAVFNTCRFNESQRPAAAVTAANSKAQNRPENAIVPSCPEMRAAFGQVIYNTAADIIGFNEVGDGMYASGQANSVQDLAAAAGCTGYTYMFYASNASGDHHFDNGFAYKSSVLTLNDSGRIWLYKEDTSPWYSTSSDSKSGSPKTNCVWAKFTHKASGRVFWLFVTQLPTASHGGNTYASKGMNSWAQAKAGSDPRQILVGDFNSAPGQDNEEGYNELKTRWTDAYEAVLAAGNLSPFYITYPGTQSGTGMDYQYSIMNFCKNHQDRRIDHIMTKNCTATSYKTIRNTYSFGSGDEEIQCYPSDHLALVSYITLD